MRFQTRHRHVIDFIFPIAVFFVFAASSLAVLMLAANIYSSNAATASENYMARTSLSYVNEKIRQNDSNGGIAIDTMDGTQCLVLEGSAGDISYTTFIYEYEGMLKELFLKDGVTASLADGKDIMAVHSFTMEEIDPGIYRFTSVDEQGNETFLMAAERSVQ